RFDIPLFSVTRVSYGRHVTVKSPSIFEEGVFHFCSSCVQVFEVSAAFEASFATVGGAALGAAAALIGTHGCTGASCPGSACGAGLRICPVGHGLSNCTGSRSGGGGGARSASASLV